MTASHTYGSAASYNATVTVTDKDGGEDAKSVVSGFKAYNTPSGILAPINTTGTRSPSRSAAPCRSRSPSRVATATR